ACAAVGRRDRDGRPVDQRRRASELTATTATTASRKPASVTSVGHALHLLVGGFAVGGRGMRFVIAGRDRQGRRRRRRDQRRGRDDGRRRNDGRRGNNR